MPTDTVRCSAAHALAAADAFAVARLQEAIELRQAGIVHRLLLLGTLLDQNDLALCSEQQIDVTAHDAGTLAAIVEAAPRHPLRVWLKLDSGMHRLGLDPAAFVAAERQLAALPGVTEVVHMTHFSSTHDMESPSTARQLTCFARCHAIAPAAQRQRRQFRGADREAGTALGLGAPGHHALRRQSAGSVASAAAAPGDAPASSGASPCGTSAPGESVGYDSCWTAERASRVATVGLGYADGYPRHAPNGTPVWIGGRAAPLAGRVSMDSITIDVTDCAGVTIGDEVTLWGPELPAAIIAERARTATYELFTGVGRRVTRDIIG